MARSARALAVVALAVSVLAGAAARAAETVTTRAAAHDGFARIVFDWPAPATYDARIDGRVLRVTFARPLSVSLDGVRRSLRAYVSDARVDADGRTVALSLTGDFSLRTFVYEKSVVVDLVGDAAASGAAAPSPALPRVDVRVGDHPGYSRIVFDWRMPVDYKVTHEDGRAIIRFDRAATIDLAALNAGPPRNIGAGEIETSGKRTIVTLAVAAPNRLRHFRSGTSVVLDVFAPRSQGAAGDRPEAPAARPREASTPPDDGLAPSVKATVEATPLPPDPAPETGAEGEPPHPLPGDAQEVAREMAPSAAALPATPAAADASAGDRPAAIAESRPAASTVSRMAAHGGTIALVPLSLPAEDAPQTVAGRSLGTTAAEISLGPAPMRVAVESTGDRSLVSFNAGKRLASAAFVHDGNVWLVFPERFSVDLTDALAHESPAYQSVVQVPHSGATVFRFRLRAGYGVALSRRGNLWLAQFTAKPEAPKAIEVRPFDDETRGIGVQLKIADVADSVQVSDPDDLTTFVVVPVVASATGVVEGRSFEGFELLATAQGIVALPKSRGFDVRTSLAGVELAYAAGPVERPAPKQRARITRRTGPATRLLDFAAWRGGDVAAFYDKSQELQRAVVVAPVEERRQARIDQLLFLFANGYFAEVLGRFELLMEEDLTVAEDPTLRAVRGISQLMHNRYEGAIADLNHPSLDAYDDIALWRGVLASRLGDKEAATVHFVRADVLWLELPHPLRNQIGLIAAEAAVEATNMTAANAYLDAILASVEDPVVIDRANYIRGRALRAVDNTDAARELWDKTVNSSDRLARAGSSLERALLMLETGETTRAEAIESLESLRFAWRGDDLELRLLLELAELYVADKAFIRGFEAMKRSVTYFANHFRTAAVTERMSELFTGMFLEGRLEDVPAREVLTLFYEFRELTPIGKGGDEVMQALADRLVAVDLLDQAADVLEHQLTYRLEGIEKSRVGTRLAVILLMNQKPERALEALAASEMMGVTRDLAGQRRQLEARALAELDRHDDAIALIRSDRSREAELLRADIFWRAGKWARAAAATWRILEQTPLDPPLGLFASQHVLRLVVALSLADDVKGLARARERYAAKMKGDANEGAFAMITSEVDRKRVPVRELPAAVAEVDIFEAFMAGYRARARNGSLSAIN